MLALKTLLRDERWYKFLYKTRSRTKLRHSSIIQKRFCSSSLSNTTDEHLDHDENLATEKEEDLLLSKRNKSGLKTYHYNIEHRKAPPFTEDEKAVMPLWRYRKLFGRYGVDAGVEAKALWPTEQEMELQKEKEKLQYPHTVHEMIRMAKTQRFEEEKSIMDRQRELTEKLKQLEKWKHELNQRTNKREQEARKELLMKEKQIEEVREILGYKISPHDPKFIEILEKKLEEDRKRAKKEKKLRKQQEMVEKLTQMAQKEADMLQGKSTSGQDGKSDDPLYGKKIE